MTDTARRSIDEPDTTASFALKMLLIIGSFWFLTVIVAIVFGLGIIL